jgi:hypothetical protein
MENDDNPSAEPPSEQAGLLRVLWRDEQRVFMALSMAATLEAEGLDSSYWRKVLALALAEAHYKLARLPGGDGHDLIGVRRCWRITAGGKVTLGN